MYIDMNNRPYFLNYKWLKDESEDYEKKHSVEEYKQWLIDTFFKLARKSYVDMPAQQEEFDKFMETRPNIESLKGIVRVAYGGLYEYASIYYAYTLAIEAEYNNSNGNFMDLTSPPAKTKVFDVKFKYKHLKQYAGADIKCCTDFRKDNAIYNTAFTHGKIKEIAGYNSKNIITFGLNSYIILFVPTKSYKVLNHLDYKDEGKYFSQDMLSSNLDDLIYVIDLAWLMNEYKQVDYNFNAAVNKINYIINTGFKKKDCEYPGDIYGFRYDTPAIIKFTDFINKLKTKR